jgi:hypothetical protein
MSTTVSPLPRSVTVKRFLTGFIAALRAEGAQYIDTYGDVHHAKFDEAIEALRAGQKRGSPGATSLPRTLMPTQMTARYRELDDALLSMQRGYLSAPNPFYPGVRLKLSKARAQKILDGFSPEQREELLRLAGIFRNSPVD